MDTRLEGAGAAARPIMDAEPAMSGVDAPPADRDGVDVPLAEVEVSETGARLANAASTSSRTTITPGGMVDMSS